MKIVLATGGFDPIHSGHLAYLRESKKLGDWLIVGVNSDAWLTRKKGKPFLPIWERVEILQNLKMVDQVVFFNDTYDLDGSAKLFIKDTLEQFPKDIVIFANGGDRNNKNIPEMDIVDPRLEFAFEVGSNNKQNSSSWILDEWKAPKVFRSWGYYRVLHNPNHAVKVKEMVVNPGSKLSMQRHFNRNELWFVAEGVASVYSLDAEQDRVLLGQFVKHQNLTIPVNNWHSVSNEQSIPLKIVEIQYGSSCIEDDIERL
jgi:cytidyltransferase-like protein